MYGGLKIVKNLYIEINAIMLSALALQSHIAVNCTCIVSARVGVALRLSVADTPGSQKEPQ
jgi:hypothetical protein